jgi:DNA-binding IclR family transcriptional regulator
VSSDATSFLAKHVRSAEALEVLVAIVRSTEQTTTIELMQTTRLPASIVRHVLRELETNKLVETTSRGTVRLSIRSARERTVIAEIVDQYDREPNLVLHALRH